MDLLISILLIIVSVMLYLYWSTKKAHRFFKDRNIPYIEPNLVYGNMGDVIQKRISLGEIYVEFYKKLAPHAFGGVFTMRKPTLVIRDPDLIRTVLIKDFANFIDRGFNTAREIDPLSQSLFRMKGDEWKNLRIKLTSTFSSGKMKMMLPLLKQCGENLSRIIAETPDNKTFDARDLFARYTTDTIGTCAFGLDLNSLNNPDSEFRIMSKKVFGFRYATMIRALWPNIPKNLIKLFNVTLIDKQVEDYFIGIVDSAVKEREQHNVTRNDFLDLLIALKNNTMLQKFNDNGANDDLQEFLEQIGNKYMKSDVDMTNDLLAAQAFVFLSVGFETAAVALSCAFLELSRNEFIQNKTRQEILHALSSNNGQLTHEAFKQMTYVDMVIDETLRKYPPGTMLIRECKENYRIPNTQVIIPSGTSVVIPVYGIHLDEKYYDKPQEFRPERFTEKEKAKRPNYTFLPFGDGPRVCIAQRFARMQIKIGLIYALKDFSYCMSPELKFPLEYQKNVGLLTPMQGILLQRQKI